MRGLMLRASVQCRIEATAAESQSRRSGVGEAAVSFRAAEGGVEKFVQENSLQEGDCVATKSAATKIAAKGAVTKGAVGRSVGGKAVAAKNAPKIVAPKSIAPRSVAPKAVAPKAVAPKAVAPKSVPPRSIAPKNVAPKSIAPKSLAPASSSKRGKEPMTDEGLLRAPEKEYMNEGQLAFFKQRLLELRTQLLTNADDTGQHLRENEVTTDPSDRATLEEEYTLELRTRDRERKLLKKVEKSLKMIDDGSYGYCEETGEPIGVPRLLARPTATLSLEAQERRERVQKLYGD